MSQLFIQSLRVCQMSACRYCKCSITSPADQQSSRVHVDQYSLGTISLIGHANEVSDTAFLNATFSLHLVSHNELEIPVRTELSVDSSQSTQLCLAVFNPLQSELDALDEVKESMEWPRFFTRLISFVVK